MKTIKSLLFLASLVMVMGGCQETYLEDNFPDLVTKIQYDASVLYPGGNVECSQIGDYEYSSGRINVEDFETLEDFVAAFPDGFTIITDGTFVTWSYTPVDGLCLDGVAVIVKGGNAANVYTYAPGVSGDSNLESPLTGGGSDPQPAGLSNLTICYNLTPCDAPCYDWQEETAWGGESDPRLINPKNGKPIGNWFFIYNGEGEQTVWAGQNFDVGTVELIDGQLVITLDDGWELQEGEETVKIGVYATPPNVSPTPGLLPLKGNELIVDVPVANFYAIHLDVRKWGEVECPPPPVE